MLKKHPRGRAGLDFNHAMIYTRNLEPSLHFYKDLLGFRLIEQYGGGYARLSAPVGKGTIALHRIEPGQELQPGAIRLYFEVKDVGKFCRGLTDAGVALKGSPKVMPWGWTHVYLDDPDGHEVSIYSAGAKRFKPTLMKKAAN